MCKWSSEGETGETGEAAFEKIIIAGNFPELVQYRNSQIQESVSQ